MGHIRIRKETKKLYFDFWYQQIRCREQTNLKGSAANRKLLEKKMNTIEAEITLGIFKYEKHFPTSPRVKTLGSKKKLTAINFNDFCSQWYLELEKTWRDSYRVIVNSLLDNHLLPYWSSKSITKITKCEIMAFRALLLEKTKPNGSPLSARHINRIMTLLKAILAEAAERHGFVSPYENIKPLKVFRSQINPMSLDEINLFLENVPNEFRNYYTTRFFTGLRTGEIDGLQWRYIDFSNRTISIRESLVNGKLTTTKTQAGQREVIMSEPVFQALQNQRQATGNNAFVFVNSANKPLCHQNITKRVWYPTLSKTGLEFRRPYQTRHTTATLWLSSGENPEWIANQLGHATTDMLFKVYSRFVPNLTHQDGSAFNQILSKQTGLAENLGF